jgi:hypothetical protein
MNMNVSERSRDTAFNIGAKLLAYALADIVIGAHFRPYDRRATARMRDSALADTR